MEGRILVHQKENRFFPVILSVGMLLTLLLSACKPTDIEEAQSGLTITSSNSETGTLQFQQTFSNGFSVDASYTQPKDVNTNAVSVYSVEYASFLENTKKFTDLFFSDQDLPQSEKLVDENSNALPNGDQPTTLHWTMDDGTTLYLSNTGTISFETPLSESISWSYSDPDSDGGAGSNADAFTKEELDSYSKQEATDAVENIVQTLGLPFGEPVNVVTLDRETLQALQVDPKEEAAKPEEAPEKKETWTEDDECYAFYFQQEVDGIPVSASVVSNERGSSNGPSLKILYGKNGVVEFQATVFNQEDSEAETVSLCNVEEPLQTIIDQYSAIDLAGDQLKLSGISLQYGVLTRQSGQYLFEYTPVYTFAMENVINANNIHTSDYTEKDTHFTTYVFVDAETGQILS
mgnify:FL=1